MFAKALEEPKDDKDSRISSNQKKDGLDASIENKQSEKSDIEIESLREDERRNIELEQLEFCKKLEQGTGKMGEVSESDFSDDSDVSGHGVEPGFFNRFKLQNDPVARSKDSLIKASPDGEKLADKITFSPPDIQETSEPKEQSPVDI